MIQDRTLCDNKWQLEDTAYKLNMIVKISLGPKHV